MKKLNNSRIIHFIQGFLLLQLIVVISLSCKNNTFDESKYPVSCYMPGNTGISYVDTLLENIAIASDTNHNNMILIPGGSFLMGAGEGEGFPEEYPQHTVKVSDFWMDIHEVTNLQFAAFVKATGYITTAERKPDWQILKHQLPSGVEKPHDSLLVPGSLVFTPPKSEVPLSNPNQWWRFVKGACWKYPEGPGTDLKGKDDHPVVHISWEDAMAYSKWIGKRLPTEAEWEWAAKGSIINAKFSWGNKELTADFNPANIWQGNFPYKNLLSDHYLTTAPVMSFPSNGYGLFDMSGNVWEWVADWMDAAYFKTLSSNPVINPTGPANGLQTSHPFQKVLKGGSFLCHKSYCTGYRVARRSSSGWESSSNHIGFRCVK